MKITKLTKEQEALIPIVRDEWLNRVFSLPKLDKPTATEGIKWLYKFCGLEEPLVVFIASPLGAQFAANLFGNGQVWSQVESQVDSQVLSQVRSQVESQVWSQVESQVRSQVESQVDSQVLSQVWSQVESQVESQVDSQVLSQVWSQVWSQVGSQVGSQVWSQVWSQVESQVRSQVRSQVESQVRSQVRSQVESQVWSQVESQVLSQVWSQVGSQVESQVWSQVESQVGSKVWSQVESQVLSQVWSQVWSQVESQVWSQVESQVGSKVWSQVESQVLRYYDTSSYGNLSDFGWLAFYDFFRRIGIPIKCEGFEPFMNLMNSSIYDMIQLKGVCIVCEMPKSIHRDNLNRLHSTTGYAIEWADGYGVHSMWGVRFEPELFNSITSRSIDPKDVMKIDNMEQRMAALRFLGAEVVLKAMDSRLVSTSNRGNALYEVSGLGQKKQYCLKYSCPSTQRQYVSFVPPEVGVKGDPDECMAWKYELTKIEYDELAFES